MKTRTNKIIRIKIVPIICILLVSVATQVCTPKNMASKSGTNIIPRAGMNLVGVVRINNKVAPGVVVSDGFAVTTTDSNGIYQLKASKEAKFVFVSLPSNAEVPVNNGLPQIYQPISVSNGSVVQRDFHFKSTDQKAKFYLMALADVQIANGTDLALLKPDIEKIKNYMQHFNGKKIGISLGDLVWDNMPFFADYAAEIKKLKIPVFSVIGNHDHDKNEKDDKLAAAKFEDFFGPAYYSYNVGDCHFIVLDDIVYNGRKDYKGEITQDQMAWLEQDLKYVDKDKLLIIGLHIPTARRGSKKGLKNSKELYALLEGYKVRILSGHTHHNYSTTISANIEENTLGAVCGAFWTGDICDDGSPRGFAVYEIEGNNIVDWHYKGTNHDVGYQLKLYAPGQAVSASLKNDVLINVFNWHSNWSVRVTENDKVYTTLTNIKEKDPEAYKTMNGKNLPTYRSFAEPFAGNDHMFSYQPTADWKYIKAEATDAYGNTYSTLINRKNH